MCYGWAIYRNQTIIARGHGACAHNSWATSNVAEYLALVAGLEAMVDIELSHDDSIEVVGDSLAVIEQMAGVSRIRTRYLKNLYNQASNLAARLPIEEWRWVQRKANKDADALTRSALYQLENDKGTYRKARAVIRPGGRYSSANQVVTLIALRAFRPAAV